MIIEALKEIHAKHRLSDGDVSVHTRSAQRITKEWQTSVCNESIFSEVPVSPENAEKIDLVDITNHVAFELKVSGNNTHHEFYKDLIKVLTYNEYQKNNNKLIKLVFISELKFPRFKGGWRACRGIINRVCPFCCKLHLKCPTFKPQAISLFKNQETSVSESRGIKSLSNRLDTKFLTMLKNTHRLSIEPISI